MNFCADIFSAMDIDSEMTLFLSSFVAYVILQQLRKNYLSGKGNSPKQMHSDPDENQIQDAPENREADNARYAQIDKALRVAFDSEDYEQVLKCWNAIKRFSQCPSAHLLQMVKAMQCCNKGAHFIVMELREFFKAHPKSIDICVINDILEPLARRLDDAQLVGLIVRMLPSINIVRDTRTYEALLAMHVARKDHVKAQEVLKDMKNSKVEFTPCAFVAVLTIAMQLKNFDAVLKTFKELKPSWEVRSTWAVSPFALQRHKTSIMTQIVELACQQRKLHQLLPALEGMAVPEEVASIVQAECSAWTDIELGTMMKLLQKTGHTSQSNFMQMLKKCLDTRSNPSKAHREAASDASTSEGSRSDSEGDEETSNSDGAHKCGLRPPAGLAPPTRH